MRQDILNSLVRIYTVDHHVNGFDETPYLQYRYVQYLTWLQVRDFFQWKRTDICLISPWKHILWVLIRSTSLRYEYPQHMFSGRIRNISILFDWTRVLSRGMCPISKREKSSSEIQERKSWVGIPIFKVNMVFLPKHQHATSAALQESSRYMQTVRSQCF